MRRKLDNHALSQTGFWDSLSDGDRETVLYWAYVQDFAKRHILFHEGERGDKVYVLVTGKVQLLQDAGENNETTVHLARPGEVLGERLLTGAIHYNCRAETLEDSTVIVLPASVFSQILQRSPKAAWHFFQSLLLRLQKTEQRMLHFRFNRTEHRIRLFLRDWVKDEGRQLATGEWEITWNMTHAMIASLSNASRQYVTDFLNTLRKQGVLRYDRRRMIIQRLDLL
jgi:CRP/FNR family transcriptional regulator, cyclic AMP receptor protein